MKKRISYKSVTNLLIMVLACTAVIIFHTVTASASSWGERATSIQFNQTKSGTYLPYGRNGSEISYNYEMFYFYVPMRMTVTFKSTGAGTNPFNVELMDNNGKDIKSWGKEMFSSKSDWNYNPATRKSSMKVSRTLSPGYYFVELSNYEYSDDVNISWSLNISGSIADKPTISSITKKGSKSVVVKWNTVSGATGYQVYMKKGNGAYKHINTLSGRKLKKTGLKKGKTYTFRIRAYKKINGMIFYSAFSTKKKKM